ncbi:competence protein CoiA [Rhizobium leguminosarum]|uniref:competence protein CoiA n=1 Tax=Rhizobium leguminosarum TaxID=384 RepID=UPI0021BBC954|nr:competence protein CoiA family protein [Rhizobium leguminosarum]
MIAKCGTKKLHHWAHKGRLECDHWWEPETEWHRNWKNQFPKDWQEVRHVAENGEVHIADVKTPKGEALEFQYSALHPDELAAREAFYGAQMTWIASGTRLKRDAEAFRRAVFSAASDFIAELRAWRMPIAKAPAIVQRWAGSRCRVFLDLGDLDFSALRLSVNYGLLWHVIYNPGSVSFMPILKDAVIGHYLSGKQLLGFESHSAENQRQLLALEAQLARRGRRRFRF